MAISCANCGYVAVFITFTVLACLGIIAIQRMANTRIARALGTATSTGKGRSDYCGCVGIDDEWAQSAFIGYDVFSIAAGIRI